MLGPCANIFGIYFYVRWAPPTYTISLIIPTKRKEKTRGRTYLVIGQLLLVHLGYGYSGFWVLARNIFNLSSPLFNWNPKTTPNDHSISIRTSGKMPMPRTFSLSQNPRNSLLVLLCVRSGCLLKLSLPLLVYLFIKFVSFVFVILGDTERERASEWKEEEHRTIREQWRRSLGISRAAELAWLKRSPLVGPVLCFALSHTLACFASALSFQEEDVGVLTRKETEKS